MRNKIIYASLLLILVIFTGCSKIDHSTEKINVNKGENILFKPCDLIGEKQNNCECIEIIQGHVPIWVCNNEIKCGNEVTSVESFKKNNCECLYPEMPDCGLNSFTGVILCAGLECKE